MRSSLTLIATTTILLLIGTLANAQPPTTPYEMSGSFVLNTNRIGFADSGGFRFTAPTDASGLPAVVLLGDPLPNPFNPLVTIPFCVGKRGLVGLNIYDLLGRRVRSLANQVFSAGNYTRQWDGRSDHGLAVSTGVYLVRINLADTYETRKISLIK